MMSNQGCGRYNVFWQPFESSGIQPSKQPMSCPSGYQLASIQITLKSPLHAYPPLKLHPLLLPTH